MGSSISAIYDYYDDYKHLCKTLGVEPVGIFDGFYEHETEILKQRGYHNIQDFYEELRKQKLRDDKINQITNI